MEIVFLMLLVLSLLLFPNGICKSLATGPPVVNIGSILQFDSTTGGVAAVAIHTALEDINSDPTVLNGTTLKVQMKDTNCFDGFLGMVQALQFMETDVIALIGPQCSTISHMISYVANELQVPLMSFASDATLSSIQFPFFVRTGPSDLYQMAAVAEVVDYNHWKIVTAIYIDNVYGRNGIAALDDALTLKRCKISYKVGFPSNAKRSDLINLLVSVSYMEPRVIVLHTGAEPGLKLFSVANQLNMMGNGYVWIATDWLSAYLDANSSVPDARDYIWPASVWAVARALDAFFDDGGRISFSNDLHDGIGGTLHLEAMSIFDMGSKLLEKIRKVNFSGISGQVQFDAVGNLIHPAYDIINVIGNGMRTIGFWSNYSGLLSTVSPEALYSKPPNISLADQHLYDVIWPGETAQRPRGWVFPSNAKQLKIGVPNRFSFKEIVTVDNATGSMKGYCIDVFTQALALLPYPVSYKFVPFGNGTENPNYDKLVQMIESNEFDAAIGDIAITMRRTVTFDFTQPFIETGLVILAPVKEHITSSWAFLQPFSLEMWCVTGLFFLIVGVVIWVLEHRINDDFRGSVQLFNFVLRTHYTASLTSILTVQQLDTSIKGIDDLKNSNDPIGFQVGSFAQDYMVKELNISRSRLRALGSPQEYAEALKIGPKEGGVMAIVDERPYVELFLSTYCKIAVAGTDFTSRGWGFAFPRDSPLQVDLSTAILSLSENGELQRIHSKWLNTGECTTDNSEFVDSNQLRLESFLGLFLICGVACVLALLLYFGIMLCKYLRHEPRKSLRRFISFVHGKEPPKNMERRSMSLPGSSTPTTPMGSLSSLDMERPARPVRNGSVIDMES
uniref:Glutamate receptor n=1 Tax=Aegilops tauschii TaxID=37682 RepID=R7W138_AEGTA